jgi:hypothetical protein
MLDRFINRYLKMGINAHLARPKSDILRIASRLGEESRIFCNIGWIAT